jgi:membrane protein YdbS with pleckstrin-like domain
MNAVAPTTERELRPPRHQACRRAIRLWTVRALLSWLIPVVIQLVVMITAGDIASWQYVALVATVLLAAAHTVVMPQWRFRVHRWEATDNAVYTQSGWLNQERRIAPVSRIQTVDSERGPLDQLFKLANVTVTTASAAGPLTIRGLDREVADRLVDELTARTRRFADDAT